MDRMANDFSKKQDEQLSKIQASIIASCSPLANLWYELDAQEMKGAKSELIRADVNCEYFVSKIFRAIIFRVK